ncbi:hypothetical protein AWR36_010475 [Microbulbifer flavimaris]|uniref:Rad50/SbcC-type AAA domain-containing protein n=1 Tax=Microbulbifer flavimaris TaxID=1781068 RepID=A0ABX4HYC9_9GAMM|nr:MULTISPECIES: AAA family ATPase [Microbulbifer]KUJ82959.1 hypothetical protein AVO43_10450 [Microbulbifer sp. ZGT114]PCO05144.1 hypothetical protein AWR36_010475 [Microbulbifer flavimaris]
MKLIKAHIRNFRLLKDLLLDFSTDDNKNVTVIRAANETGKTTCKSALLWGLFGDKALPGEGKKFPLFPSDMRDTHDRVETKVEVEFESDQVVTIGRGAHELQKKHYRLTRSCYEYPVDGERVRREANSVTLYEIKPEGTDRVLDSHIDSVIESCIPIALKDVYITDGDAAMSFIEAAATQGVKRKRVSSAIESLLGLDLLKRTSSHLSRAASRFSSLIDNTDYKAKLELLNNRILSYEEDINDWESERKDLETSISESSIELSSTRKKIEDLLRLGDKGKLVEKMQKTVRSIEKSKEGASRALTDISSLTNSSDLSAALISKTAKKGMELLNAMSSQKQLPKVNVPILEELLDRDKCFCGSDLSKETDGGQKARASIEASIEKSRAADTIQESATSLFYSVRSEHFDECRKERWLESYASRTQDYMDHNSRLSGEQNELKRLNAEKDSIDDSALISLRELEDQLSSKLNSARINQGQLDSKIDDARMRKKDAEDDRRKIEKKLSKTDSSSDKLAIARTTQNLFDRIVDRLLKEELRKVSDEMNRIFLEMIGSDPDANELTMITGAELTEDYDILVYGPSGHPLNPDQDLNGASRRAITLAFILALTKVSRVEAPNVIDTPLGMMAGYVKRSVLERTAKEGSQVVLFLTHDEIAGVEDILDVKAGKIFTLTNPAHYPRMLANEPQVSDSRILRCECDHRSTCAVCERRTGTFA